MSSRRVKRVRELIREEASRLLVTKVKDDRLRVITITEADVSPDLKKAVIYYSIMDLTPDRQITPDEIKRALQKSTGFFRREIARVLDLKFAPDLRFRRDETFAEAGRIDALLNSPRVRQDLDKD